MLRSKIPPDRSKIELHHPDEVKYWSRHLRITADELQRVIEKVGNAAATVRKGARGQWRIRRRRISISRLSDRRRGGPAAW